MRLRKLRRIGGLITVGVALSVLLAGCFDAETAAGGATGCRTEFDGVTGVDRPETSGLSCDDIDRLIDTMPSEPETFLTSGDSPRLLWKCKFYGTEGQRVLFWCEHDNRHFRITKEGS